MLSDCYNIESSAQTSFSYIYVYILFQHNLIFCNSSKAFYCINQITYVFLYRYSPMHISCQNGHRSVVELLVNFGAEVNLITIIRYTSHIFIVIQPCHISITISMFLNAYFTTLVMLFNSDII